MAYTPQTLLVPVFSIQDIANARGYSYEATKLHIRKLKEDGKFTKTGVGIYMNEVDISALEKLLGFTMPKKVNGVVPKQTRMKF